LGTLTLGASGYKGTYTDSHDEFVVDASGNFVTTHPVTAQYKELSLAADVKWELAGLLVQGEVIMNDTAYPDDLRPPAFPAGFTPDHRRVGVYGIAGYRLPFLGTMPFFGSEYYDIGVYTFSHSASAVFGGLNVRPTARVVLKAQYTYSWFGGSIGPDLGHFSGLDLQAAWSF